MADTEAVEQDEDGLDAIKALVADAAPWPRRMVHEGSEYYAERIIRRAIAQGTLALTRTPPIDVEAVARDLFDFLCRKYVQRSNERQQSMGLQYTEAETHDLAKEIARFIAAMRANEEKS